jgi:hypothetical protein
MCTTMNKMNRPPELHSKALVAEMVGNFSKRLEKYGINVRELTGMWWVGWGHQHICRLGAGFVARWCGF